MTAARQGGPERFPTTAWSLVAQVGREDAEEKREALGRLLVRYLPALQAHLVYGKRLPPERADDLIQEFVAGKIIEKDLIARADRQLGKFRTFLLTALDRFVMNQFRDERAKKRAPSDAAVVALDERQDGSQTTRHPSEAFDIAWARGIVSQALQRMRVECESSGRDDVWGVFECRVVGPTLEGSKPVDYRELVRRFGFQSPSQASNALITGKRMYARALRAVVGEYADGPQEIESEIEELREILARSAR